MTISGRDDATAGTRIRLGMVGGGDGAFIGAVHRLAARMDDQYQLVAGALASTRERAMSSGRTLGLAPDRTYEDFRAMAVAEAARPDGIEAVAIVTPNHLHHPVARAFIEAGVHVICDKPLTASLAEARELARLVAEKQVLFAVTYNYSGYPMVRHARQMVQAGEIGELRLVHVEYVQGWLATKLEETGQKQAAWRTDPAKAGAGGCIGDIGTHAFQLGNFVSGLVPESLCADLTAFVPGRKLDDNTHVMLRFKGGAKGMLWASQVAIGNENRLRLRIYGTKGGIEWAQEDPNYLWLTMLGEPKRLITRGGDGANEAAARVTRVPPGHPEGYLEGFANIYAEVARAIQARRAGAAQDPGVMFPGVEDGLAGVAFVEAAVRSSSQGGVWIRLD